MDGAADLLVEQDLAGAVGDPVVGADPEFTETPCSVVRVAHLDQDLLALLGARVHDLAALESEVNSRDLSAGVARRQVEADLSLGRVLDGAGEELTVRHVVLAVSGDEGASLDAEAQV